MAQHHDRVYFIYYLLMKSLSTFSVFSILAFILSSCSQNQKADLIVRNAIVYTVDSLFSTAESFAVKDGKFIAIGSNTEIETKYEAKETMDAHGKAIYPGFIDSHCHFYGYGKGLTSVNLVGTKSFEEVIQRVVQYAKTNKSEWIIGRGWDQNDWAEKGFPSRYQLDELFPEVPVCLQRIDGHAALVNHAALKLAEISADTKVQGGVIQTDKITSNKSESDQWFSIEFNKEIKNIKYPFSVPSGILIDNAVDLVQKIIPKPSVDEITASLLAAQKNCFAVGLTTVDDAGLEKKIIDQMDALQKSGELKMRIYAMLTDNAENLDYYLQHGIYKTERLNVRSFKFYADGALGSRGACLCKPYTDQPLSQGLLLSSPDYFRTTAKRVADKGFQMNTHCIGDSAVRLLLSVYAPYLANHCNTTTPKTEQSLRWRIEHFQVTSLKDIDLVKCLNQPATQPHAPQLIPSVQPTHATSDMYWAKQRLGDERIHYAYAYNDLLNATGMLALGTDFPVEDINPMYTFYAGVTRKDLKGFPDEGFQTENALSRENTLRGMTIWGAYANFEEHEKGSIEPGKFADFIMLDNDIMKCDAELLPHTNVTATYLNGVVVFRK